MSSRPEYGAKAGIGASTRTPGSSPMTLTRVYPRPAAFCVYSSLGIRSALRFILIRCIPAGPAVFGNSETFKRVPLPAVLENLSRVLKASLVLFWGRWGLPIPFKVRSIDEYGVHIIRHRDDGYRLAAGKQVVFTCFASLVA